jgi:archaeosine-15-forming tRNA-guanine transglycosylase
MDVVAKQGRQVPCKKMLECSIIDCAQALRPEDEVGTERITFLHEQSL